jgi:hypothetical protein
MISVQTKVSVPGMTADEIFTFMLGCTDADYQAWWPGTHLAWHTLERHSNGIGNRVYFDEFVGPYRLKFHGVVTRAEAAELIEWQMIKWVRLPAWLTLEFEQRPDGTHLTHTVRAGYEGTGRILDHLLRLYFSDSFAAALDEHARQEFPMLGELLHYRRRSNNPHSATGE